MKEKRTILIVNDNRIILTVLEHIVENFGFNCLSAEDGAQALEVLTEGVCCIISDIKMPTMDGFELIKQLRREERYRSHFCTPIIVSTADNVSDDGDIGISDMPHVYSLGFPIKPESLRALLQQLSLLEGS